MKESILREPIHRIDNKFCIRMIEKGKPDRYIPFNHFIKLKHNYVSICNIAIYAIILLILVG